MIAPACDKNVEFSCTQTHDSCVPNPHVLDQTGRELLRLVQADGERTLHELGDAVGLSGPAVQRRLRRYRELGLIRGTTTLLDGSRLGGYLTVLNLATLDRDSGPAVARLRARLLAHPNVQQCYELAGNFDLATILVVPDMEVYREVIDELFGRDRNVRRFATHVTLDTIKAALTIPL